MRQTVARKRSTSGSPAAADWPGALLCPVTKGGTVQRRPMGAQAVMMRVRAIAKRAGGDPVTPNDLCLTYSTGLQRQQLEARAKGRPAGLLASEMLPVPYQMRPANE